MREQPNRIITRRKYRQKIEYRLAILAVFFMMTACRSETMPKQGDTRTDPSGIEQVWVPAGSFMMGTVDFNGLEPPYWAKGEMDSEQPVHLVTLSQGYWIDKYEVTNASFQAFVDAGGYTTETYWSAEGLKWLSKQKIAGLPVYCGDKASLPDLPRVCVTWYEAEAYASWRGGRLPTEAEWEFAARGPESLIYPWGNEFDPAKANVLDSEGLTPVGTYPAGASWVGAHDMAGNAMEWVQDWLDYTYYQQIMQDNPPETVNPDGIKNPLGIVDPQGPAEGRIKIEKGGWWGSNLFVARAAYHHFEDPPTYQDHHIGFRIVTPAAEK